MDIDWLIVIDRAFIIGGAAAVLFGLISMARPIAAIGLGSRTRAGLVVLAALCIVSGGIALFDFHCDPTIPCGRCFGNRRPPITAVQSCLRPVTANDRDIGHEGSKAP